jgi:NADH dehydrogenase [ubiquinone] 1 alpha subcomplex assembly factor 5
MNETAAPFDRALQRHFAERALGRAGAQEGSADFLYQAASEDVALRLNAILRDFPIAADLTTHSGQMAQMLTSIPKVRQVVACARSSSLIPQQTSARANQNDQSAALVCDDEALPFAPRSLDLVTSVLGLQWVNDLPGTLVQIRRALKPDGLFIAALIGGDSLTELRQSLLAAEAEMTGGAHARVSPFADLRDMGALLQRSGFALPVVDVETLTVRYASPDDCLMICAAWGRRTHCMRAAASRCGGMF